MEQAIEIKLRPLSVNDTDFMVALASNHDVGKYLPTMITDRQMMQDWIRGLEPPEHEYIVLLDDTKIGECSLAVSTDHSAEIGFILFPEYWGRGCGTAVVRELLEKARQMSIGELTAKTDVNNAAAIQLLTKFDFQKQYIGWILALADAGNELSRSQTIIQFKRTM